MNTDPTAIAAGLFSQLEQAWNAADGAAFGAPFAVDADFVDIRGTHHTARAAIAAGHQVIFDTIYKDTTIHYEVTNARLLDSGTLLAHANAELDPPLPHAKAATCSIVATKSGAEWQIAAFHNTLVSV